MIEKSYITVIDNIKEQIRSVQHKAFLSANKEVIILYWNIGKIINENSVWGNKFLKRLSFEIKNEFLSAKGFSFVGNQYHLEVGEEDFYIDLLFYNIKSKCYVVVKLKIGEVKHEYTGKWGSYLMDIDELVKEPNDNPTIGLLLCNHKNDIIAKYTLRYINKPVGVSEYQIKDLLQEEL